jgi:L-rhamnose mutarotase
MRHAFKLAIRPGTELEYERRHRAVYPELLQVFREADVKTYSINISRRSYLIGLHGNGRSRGDDAYHW